MKKELKDIDVADISINPENPRIFFRPKEMEDLALSIESKGLQVPISAYKDGDKYILIDGERRWKTFNYLKANNRDKKYNKIPAIIQHKPSDLDNILLMFNIHGLREQWDIFTVAMKLEKVMKLLKQKNGAEATEAELSKETGMPRSSIRRSKMIIALPVEFKRLLRTELEKPKNEQRFSEDFFIEMENSLRAVNKYFPQTLSNINKVRDILIAKYLDGIIVGVTEFRKLTKIATAPKNTSYSSEKAKENLKTIFSKNKIGIEEVYRNSVEIFYGDKRLVSNVNSIYLRLTGITREYVRKDKQLKEGLAVLREEINKLLK